jgi:hypothetical protein
VNSQYSPSPGPCFTAIVVSHKVVVSIRRDNTIVYMWIRSENFPNVGCINPGVRECGQIIIQRWLAALLLPRTRISRILVRETIAVGERLDHRVVPQLVGHLE